MLRFLNTEFVNSNKMMINNQSLLMDNTIWENYRLMLAKDRQYKENIFQFTPIKTMENKVVAYGFQDNEANRELRMLKELRQNENALQFTDIFPEYKEVTVCGCNELAVSFVEYLKKLGIAVSVIGNYWNYLGYQNNRIENLGEGGDKLLIYAEGIPFSDNSIAEKMKRSVSPEFECIDKIYEANVLEGKIFDADGNFEGLIAKLKEKQEIILLGDDNEAQDVYDLLLSYGIDICAFAVQNKRNGMLLGRPTMSAADAMKHFQAPVFISCKEKHSALGEKWTEYFDYRGFERNKQFFLIKDYLDDIPVSNLVHVMRGRQVWLTGDKRLCGLLSNYLYQVENGEVTVNYLPLSDKLTAKQDDILCLVIPDYHNRIEEVGTARTEQLAKQLFDMGFVHYTEYFIGCGPFVLIECNSGRNTEKYSIPELTPKGILIGRIPGQSGNYFFRGILDGHPEILMMHYSDLNENLFYYCMRLANVETEDILSNFWAMYDEEAGSKSDFFPYPDKFEKSIRRFFTLKKRFTSQELFVLFHIAYMEMVSGEQTVDIAQLVIYWEPHFVCRKEFSFFALWLEDEKVKGQTIALRRNNIVRIGSQCARGGQPFNTMFLDESIWSGVEIQYRYWKEIKMRFEDIKLKPREKLMEICNQLEIAWSETMLQTTALGKPQEYRGSMNFDLKAVFNNYEDFLSEYDRFRISIASSPYQKRYGYPYVVCLQFSRRELQEMFLKSFRFEEKRLLEKERRKIWICEQIRWNLWKVRIHMLLNDIIPEFDRFEVGQSGETPIEHKPRWTDKIIKYIKGHNQLILYGTGNDCLGILDLLEENEKSRLLYSDKKAASQPYFFLEKRVISPEELCTAYRDYNILITSSLYRLEIENEFIQMGIAPYRVFYNKWGFGNEI